MTDKFADLYSCFKANLYFVLASASNDVRLYLHVTIYGKQFLGLLDYVAVCSAVCSRWFRSSHVKKFELERLSLVGSCPVANGEPCSVVGSYDPLFCLQGNVKTINVSVVSSLPLKLILGSYFWKKMVIPDLRHFDWSFFVLAIPERLF